MKIEISDLSKREQGLNRGAWNCVGPILGHKADK